MSVLFLGIVAGVIQTVGYVYYLWKTKRDDISPNPTTWLIFAADTTLLAILEAFAGASIALLILPFACALCAIYVAYILRKSGRLRWPEDDTDRIVLIIAFLIAILYTYIFILWNFQIIEHSLFLNLGILFLILSNLNTFIAFIPITNEVYKYPEREHAGPWAVWTLAYVLLGVATYLEVGFELGGLIFYLYPVICAVLHGAIAYLARDARKKEVQVRNRLATFDI